MAGRHQVNIVCTGLKPSCPWVRPLPSLTFLSSLSTAGLPSSRRKPHESESGSLLRLRPTKA